MLTKSRGLVASLPSRAACGVLRASRRSSTTSRGTISLHGAVVASFRTKVDDSLETLRTTADAQEWHTAAGEAVRGLGLLRAEGGLTTARPTSNSNWRSSG